MNKRRLLKLAGLLEADAKNKKGVRFDLRFVGKKVDDEGETSGFGDDEMPKVDCGTAACAVGLACISGAFKRAGLTYDINYAGEVTPVFQGLRGWNTAEVACFDISVKESDFLFHPDRYPAGKIKGAVGERYVAKRIRDFVAGKVEA